MNPDVTRVLKIHGSLDWKKHQDDVIVGGMPTGPINYEPAIVFGAGNKLRYYGPFLDLMRAFTDALYTAEYVVTIGYGFRDPHINEALRIWGHQAPGDGARKRLLVGLGPDNTWLPQLAQELERLEHLDVTPQRKDATTAVRVTFGSLNGDPSLPA
jgi:hypothetical protein